MVSHVYFSNGIILYSVNLTGVALALWRVMIADTSFSQTSVIATHFE